MRKAILFITLAICVSACKGTEKAAKIEPSPKSGAAQFDAKAAPVAASDAGPKPTSKDAASVLRDFSEKLLSDDLAGARANLRVPQNFKNKQIDFFLQELQAPENLSKLGVEAVLQAEFGSLQERFGEKAEGVANSLGIPLDSLYAFGDTSAAAVLFWDGQRFRVAALHKLAAP